MATVKYFSAGTISEFVDFINAESPNWVSGSEGVINIGNIITITCSSDAATITYNGSDVSTNYDYSLNRGIVAYDDTLFYMQSFTGSGNRICTLVETIEDITISGIISSSGSTTLSFQPINNFDLLDLNTSIIYKHANILNYTAKFADIDATHDILFSDSKAISIIDPHFVSCSQIDSQTVQSFNGKSYYAVGPCTLVQMDTEEV